jgi:hypothetical protein
MIIVKYYPRLQAQEQPAAVAIARSKPAAMSATLKPPRAPGTMAATAEPKVRIEPGHAAADRLVLSRDGSRR